MHSSMYSLSPCKDISAKKISTLSSVNSLTSPVEQLLIGNKSERVEFGQ